MHLCFRNRFGVQLMLVIAVMLLFASIGLTSDQVIVTMKQESRLNYRAWQEAVVAEFEKEHPNIKVEMQPLSGSVPQQILVRSVAGVAPDLAFHDPHTVIDFARQGLIADLTSYFERDAEYYSNWLPSATNFFQYQGGRYGLPQDIQLGGIYYNVDSYNETGLSLPPGDWTYDDLRDNARKLTKKDHQGEIIRYGYKIPTWRNWVSVIWAHGGDYVDSWTDPTEFIGRNEGVIAGIEYLKSLVDSEAVQDKETHSKVGITAGFTQQLIAMGQTNTIAIDSFREIDNFTWDVAPLPTGPAGQTIYLNARGWFIMEDSPRKDEAWLLLRYFTSEKALKMLVEYVGSVPPSRDGVLDDWLPQLDMPRNRHLLTLGLESARPPGELSNSVFRPISEETHAVIWGEKPINAALEDMELRVNQAIEELNN